jgi:co-chaperonin GroES (HSP10)
MPQVQMIHARDPADEIWERIGGADALNNVQVLYSQVLVAIYKRPDKTVSGIHLPDQTRDEDRYQGKACLVLKCGPQAFVDADDVKFHGQSVGPGDWIVIRPSDGWAITINKTDCRIVNDVAIKLKINEPDIVW